MSLLMMKDLELDSRRVMIREDFNVPMDNGSITSDARLTAALPTIQLALDKGAAVILLSHLGRPTEGANDPGLSLQPVATRLSEQLGRPVRLISDWVSGFDLQPGDVVLCENVRFNRGEKSNDEDLAKKIAKLCDVFVMDAFATAHRAHASTHGVACFAPTACAGPLLTQELDALSQATGQAKSPVLAIVGGAKISTKLTVLNKLCERVDQLILGGGILNTFIAASGYNVGSSLYEKDLVESATEIMHLAEKNQCDIPLPIDVITAKSFSADAAATTKLLADIESDDMILDVGSKTCAHYASFVAQSNTILWNGPVGVFEFDTFSTGTKELGLAIAKHHAFSLAGGGDTIAALDKFGITDKISYVSTGGGALLEFLEGKTLPAIEVLEQRAHETKG